MSHLGKHLLAEFIECQSERLDDTAYIQREMEAAALSAKATIVESVFHHFSPFGVSGVVVIAESHLSIHTWPEYNYTAIDVFTCGDTVDPYVALDYLKQAFQANTVKIQHINRGNVAEVCKGKAPVQGITYPPQASGY